MTGVPGSVEVRLATSDDSSDIDAIRRSAAAEAPRHRGERAPLPSGTAESFVLLGRLGDTTWGALECATVDGARWIIGLVHVLESARKVGIGDALLVRCAEEVRSRGGTHLASSAQPGDRELKNLFERHGLVARTILVGRDLSGPSSGEDVSR